MQILQRPFCSNSIFLIWTNVSPYRVLRYLSFSCSFFSSLDNKGFRVLIRRTPQDPRVKHSQQTLRPFCTPDLMALLVSEGDHRTRGERLTRRVTRYELKADVLRWFLRFLTSCRRSY